MRFLLLPLAFICFQTFAGDLEFRTLSAQEGGENFSLQGGLTTKYDESSDDDYDYGHGNKGSTFDSVDITPFIKVSPATKFSVSAKRSGFLLLGDFKPETTYKVTLKAGLSSNEGNRLAKDIEKEVATGALSPRFTFKSKARYLPGTMQGSLPWEAVNLDQVEFEVRQVFSQNFHQWLTTGENANNFVSEPVKTVVIPIKNVKNRVVAGAFSLSDLDTLGQGVFVVVAKPPTKKEEDTSAGGDEDDGESDHYSRYQRDYDTATVVVTNLTVIAKKGVQGAKVWVVDTKDLSPVKGAQVELVASSNRRLDQCKTSGSNAECALTWKKSEHAQPYALIVRSGKDLTYVRFEDLALPNDTFHIGKREFSASSGGLDAYVYSERDLYRPGETVRMSAMIRNTAFEAVPKLPLRWTITNPRGKVVRESVSDTSELGIAQMEYPSSAAGDTGKYQIAVLSGKNILHETAVLIEEFVPERIGLKVTPGQEVNVGKKQVAFKIDAKYLFGPPVANGKYKISCSMRPAFTSIPGRPDFATGIFSKEPRQPVTLEAQEGSLDSKGLAQQNCGIEAGTGKLTEAFELKAKVDVNEAGSGRATTKVGTAYVASTDTLVGLKFEGSKGRTIRVRGGLFDFKGGVKQNRANLKVRLLNVREHWYYTSGGYDSWRVEEIISPTGVEKSVDVASGTFDIALEAPEGWGRWIVRAIDTKSGYTADVDAGHIGWWRPEGPAKPGMRAPEPNALKVELSKREASPGDKVQAMIDAPFKGRVLFAFETDQTLESHWVDVDKPGPVKIDLRVPEALPNVYVTAMMLKDPVDGKRFLPARAWGAASIQVVPAAYRLDVKVTHPELSESRKSVTIQLANTQKASTEYTLAVVDEGILQMTDFKSPDPVKRFFEGRAMGVSSVETMGWTVTVEGDGGKKPGGDRSADAAGKNMPVKLVSFYYTGVKSDSSGRAEVKVPLPAFQGKVRVMAVASGKDRMGSASSAMTVRDPLVLQSTLPRFLTQGDKFQFPVSITNLSGKEQSVSVDVNVAAGLVALTASKQTVTVADGKSAVLKFDADVKGVHGNAAILVTAASADGKLKSEEKFDLPVKPSGVEQTIRLTMDAKQEVLLASHMPKDWRTDYARVEASVSPMPYLNQISHLETLIHYPYGCIEQTTSATMPLLVLGDLLQWVDPKKANKDEIKRMVNKGIARVAAMQTASGGFGYWPGAGKPSPWGTAYATNMLLDAKKLGYEVSTAVLKSALDYLETFARNSRYSLINDTHHGDSASSPFALYVLAKSGRAVTPQLRDTVRTYNPVNFTNAGTYWKGLNAENYFLLSAAAKILGDSQTQKSLNDQSLYSIQLVGDVDDEYTYWSPMRSDGLRLSVLEDIAEKHPAVEMLAQRVAASLAKKDGYYYSTQDVAWSVLALGKRMNGMKKLSPSAYAKMALHVDDKKIAKSFDVMGAPGYTFEGPSLNAAKVRVSDPPSDKGVFLYVKATGYTKTPPQARSSTVKITRNFYTREGSQLNPSSIKQGETVFVELVVQNTDGSKLNNVAIVDRVPAGFEIENPRLGRSEDLQWMAEPYKADYQDLRDDRIQVFGTLDRSSTQSIFYSARAVTKGRFTAPAPYVEAMYEPGNFDYDQDTAVQIVDAKK